MRTDEYRYTEFVRWNGTSLSPIWDEVVSRALPSRTPLEPSCPWLTQLWACTGELYDHRQDIPGTAAWEAKDDFEDENTAANAEPALLKQLAAKLREAFGDGGRPRLASD